MSFTIHPESAPVLTDRIAFWDWPTRIDRKEVYIDQILQAVCGRGWVDEEDRHWLHLCLEEVVLNAMLHGNEGDPDLRVRVGIYRDEGDWVILIRDQGRGFTPSAVPDVNDPESLLLEHGRGILLMGEWLDQLCYYAGGSVACLRRRIIT
jgi:serine/threonine-protein kinase RsbW